MNIFYKWMRNGSFRRHTVEKAESMILWYIRLWTDARLISFEFPEQIFFSRQLYPIFLIQTISFRRWHFRRIYAAVASYVIKHVLDSSFPLQDGNLDQNFHPSCLKIGGGAFQASRAVSFPRSDYETWKDLKPAGNGGASGASGQLEIIHLNAALKISPDRQITNNTPCRKEVEGRFLQPVRTKGLVT
jgi:hypothetical protein